MPDTLTDAKIRQAKPAAKPGKIFDGRGLFLLITPTVGSGGALSTFGGKAKSISLGVYPDVACERRGSGARRRASFWPRALILVKNGRPQRRSKLGPNGASATPFKRWRRSGLRSSLPLGQLAMPTQ